MRDIKFRVWDKANNKMTYHFLIDSQNKELWFYTKNGMQLRTDSTTKLLEYTGLKDKNDVEIYDGDKIKCTDGADEIDIRDSDTGIGYVEWNYTYGFWSISKIENGLGDILQRGYVEVIGNKYKNPELLI